MSEYTASVMGDSTAIGDGTDGSLVAITNRNGEAYFERKSAAISAARAAKRFVLATCAVFDEDGTCVWTSDDDGGAK